MNKPNEDEGEDDENIQPPNTPPPDESPSDSPPSLHIEDSQEEFILPPHDIVEIENLILPAKTEREMKMQESPSSERFLMRKKTSKYISNPKKKRFKKSIKHLVRTLVKLNIEDPLVENNNIDAEKVKTPQSRRSFEPFHERVQTVSSISMFRIIFFIIGYVDILFCILHRNTPYFAESTKSKTITLFPEVQSREQLQPKTDELEPKADELQPKTDELQPKTDELQPKTNEEKERFITAVVYKRLHGEIVHKVVTKLILSDEGIIIIFFFFIFILFFYIYFFFCLDRDKFKRI
jgi:hypothetical protein